MKNLILAMVLVLAMGSVALAIECVEWATWTETYVCGSTPVYDSKGKQIGTTPIYCEREKKKCIRWDNPVEPPKGPLTGPPRSELDESIILLAQTIDPEDLKKSDPKPLDQKDLQKSAPPPLEKQEQEKSPLEKFKEKIEPPEGPQSGPPRAEGETIITISSNSKSASTYQS